MNINCNFSFFSLLALLFIGLKLMGYISWSWLWVLAPIWGSFILAFISALIIVLCNHYS